MSSEECFPIVSPEDVPHVLANPPRWTQRAVPLAERSPTVVQNNIDDCHCQVLTPRPRLDRRLTPRTLVCHDYKGGYLEDKNLTSTDTGNLYSFYNWAHIDVFVYFSHHFITIPPLCWINAAHRHGVKVLGTLITESNQGEELCAKIFKDEVTMSSFAASLVEILRIFKFDGWLLNIENALEDTAMLKKFVRLISSSAHASNPSHLIIWYDSITEKGELNWQNELNEHNKVFFDMCDGIFLNYVWTEENMSKTAAVAQHRMLDVYVGIDVFGRNTYGGGEFNCFKAAGVIREHNLSMAVFAPGWTHETIPDTDDQRQFFENFINRDSALWKSLWPCLYTHPVTHPFKTSFFIGVNQVVHDIFSQNQQLSNIKHPKTLDGVENHQDIHTLGRCNCLQCAFTDKDVRCLISKENFTDDSRYIHRLFACDIPLEGTITVHILTQPIHYQENHLSLILLTVDKNGAFKKINCCSTRKALPMTQANVDIKPSSSPALSRHVARFYPDFMNEHVIITYSLYTAGNRMYARWCQQYLFMWIWDRSARTEVCKLLINGRVAVFSTIILYLLVQSLLF